MSNYDTDDFIPINWKKKRPSLLALDEYPQDKYPHLSNRGVREQVPLAQIMVKLVSMALDK